MSWRSVSVGHVAVGIAAMMLCVVPNIVRADPSCGTYTVHGGVTCEGAGCAGYCVCGFIDYYHTTCEGIP